LYLLKQLLLKKARIQRIKLLNEALEANTYPKKSNPKVAADQAEA